MGLFFKSKLEKEYDSKKKELSQLEKRRDQVQDVIDNIGSAFSDNVEDINKKINAAVNSMTGGVSGVSKADAVRSTLSSKKENYADQKLSDAKDQLIAERRRLNDKISSLQAEVNRLRARIENGETE